MRDLRKKLWTSLLWVSLFASGAGWAEGQALIVNPDVVQSKVSEDTVRALFTMRLRRCSDGVPVRVFVLPDRHPVHRDFAKTTLGVFPHQLRRAWDRLVFTGTGQAPREVANEAEMLEWVAKSPGAVGYVSNTTRDPRVRVIEME